MLVSLLVETSGQLRFPSFKEKSWSLKIVDGHISNNKVRAEQCVDCKSSCELVTYSCGDPNMVLYGCKGHKCKHTVIRLRFSPESTPL
jgi:hypothetical protein